MITTILFPRFLLLRATCSATQSAAPAEIPAPAPKILYVTQPPEATPTPILVYVTPDPATLPTPQVIYINQDGSAD